jgi:hypothetical protein
MAGRSALLTILPAIAAACANSSPPGEVPAVTVPSNGVASAAPPAAPPPARPAAPSTPAEPPDTGAPGPSRARAASGPESIYEDPNNLPAYPCERPEPAQWSLRSLDAGAPRDAAAPRDDGGPVNGRLPPIVIQKIVRDHFSEYRACYETGLGRNRNLSGRVAIKFIIDRSGTVRDTQPVCTSLPDDAVVRCIVDGFNRLSFPDPEGGLVTVVYPILFTPRN